MDTLIKTGVKASPVRDTPLLIEIVLAARAADARKIKINPVFIKSEIR